MGGGGLRPLPARVATFPRPVGPVTLQSPRSIPSCPAARNRAKGVGEHTHLPGPHHTGYLPGARKSTTLSILGTSLTRPRDQTIPRLRQFTAPGTFCSNSLARGLWISSCSSPCRRGTPSAEGWGGETETYSRWAGQFQQYSRCRHPLNPRWRPEGSADGGETHDNVGKDRDAEPHPKTLLSAVDAAERRASFGYLGKKERARVSPPSTATNAPIRSAPPTKRERREGKRDAADDVERTLLTHPQ